MLVVPLPSPVWSKSEDGYTLSRDIPAIQIMPGQCANYSRFGLMTKLPRGAELGMGGPGFDEHTVRVRCAGVDYYVFLDDLEAQRKPVTAAAAAV